MKVHLTVWVDSGKPHPSATLISGGERTVETYAVDDSVLLDIAREFDLMLIERDGVLKGFVDTKGKRFRQR